MNGLLVEVVSIMAIQVIVGCSGYTYWLCGQMVEWLRYRGYWLSST